MLALMNNLRRARPGVTAEKEVTLKKSEFMTSAAALIIKSIW